MTVQPAEFAARNAEREAEALTRAEDVLWLVERDEEPGRACARVGTSLAAVAKVLDRHNRHADWEKIAAARPRSLHTMKRST